MKSNKEITYCAMFTTLAMIFSYVESMIPINFGIPGMKLGLANLVTVVGICLLRPGQVFLIIVMRILLTGFMFGNGMSIIYSLAGGILSFLIMLFAMKKMKFSIAGVSILGGIFHNVGQIMVAALVVESLKMVYYLPVLTISGTVTGMLIGIVGNRIVEILEKTNFFSS